MTFKPGDEVVYEVKFRGPVVGIGHREQMVGVVVKTIKKIIVSGGLEEAVFTDGSKMPTSLLTLKDEDNV